MLLLASVWYGLAHWLHWRRRGPADAGAEMRDAVLGIDIGGTKLAAGVVDAEGRLRSSVRAPTPRAADADVLLAAVLEVSRQACERAAIAAQAIGVGCGGPMRYWDGLVSPLHLPAWRDFPLPARLQAAFDLPVTLDNDANAFALGEAKFGAGRGAPAVLGVIVSTGVGGGIVLDGRVYHGVSGNAGHIGHMIVSPRGPRCDCGAIGCLTAWAAGSALARRATQALDHGAQSSLGELPRGCLSGQTIAAAAAAGDALAGRLLREAGTALGRALAGAAALLDIRQVVVGGGIAQSGDLLFVPLREELRRRAKLDYLADLAVRAGALGLEAGVIGAAALAL